MRPWFAKPSEIPAYISLPDFFIMTKTTKHWLDEKNFKTKEAIRAKQNRDKQRLEKDLLNPPTTAATHEPESI
jgi:hypothetical protein